MEKKVQFPGPERETPTAKPSSAAPCSTPIFQRIYEHGGSRIWRETKDGRALLADTYGNVDMAVAVKKFIEGWLAENA